MESGLFFSVTLTLQIVVAESPPLPPYSPPTTPSRSQWCEVCWEDLQGWVQLRDIGNRSFRGALSLFSSDFRAGIYAPFESCSLFSPCFYSAPPPHPDTVFFCFWIVNVDKSSKVTKTLEYISWRCKFHFYEGQFVCVLKNLFFFFFLTVIQELLLWELFTPNN